MSQLIKKQYGIRESIETSIDTKDLTLLAIAIGLSMGVTNEMHPLTWLPICIALTCAFRCLRGYVNPEAVEIYTNKEKVQAHWQYATLCGLLSVCPIFPRFVREGIASIRDADPSTLAAFIGWAVAAGSLALMLRHILKSVTKTNELTMVIIGLIFFAALSAITVKVRGYY